MATLNLRISGSKTKKIAVKLTAGAAFPSHCDDFLDQQKSGSIIFILPSSCSLVYTYIIISREILQKFFKYFPIFIHFKFMSCVCSKKSNGIFVSFNIIFNVYTVFKKRPEIYLLNILRTGPKAFH
jgi:hypothetical protein